MYFFLTLCIALVVSIETLQAQKGYFCVPVADLVAKPYNARNENEIINHYNKIPTSPDSGKQSCLRVHQGIFNEQVSIVEYKDYQVHIELINCFAQQMPGKNIYPIGVWTRADWVISENELKQGGISSSIFPDPLCYRFQAKSNHSCITLLVPWYDSETDTTYSAGTRFVALESLSLTDQYAIILYNHTTHCAVASVIPKIFALPVPFETFTEQKKAFVELLYMWCSLQGEVPFVWGGTSFVTLCYEDDRALLNQENLQGSLLSYWNRPKRDDRPCAGLDGSGLILRAAQIVGLPFYCLNSATIANCLQQRKQGEALQEGDIIWSPSYVSVIGSIERNEMIEAQGYSRGYGKVHVIQLKNRFADINTWDDFLYCCDYSIPLRSLQSNGTMVSSVAHVKIFKFRA